MIALLILLVGGIVAVGLWSWLASSAGARGPAGSHVRSSRDGDRGGIAGLRSARAITEDREALDAEDLAQLLAANNAWRRRRGRPERTAEDLEMMVAADALEVRRAREMSLAERDLDQLLEATNARRRARGLPERDLGEVRRRYGADGER